MYDFVGYCFLSFCLSINNSGGCLLLFCFASQVLLFFPFFSSFIFYIGVYAEKFVLNAVAVNFSAFSVDKSAEACYNKAIIKTNKQCQLLAAHFTGAVLKSV